METYGLEQLGIISPSAVYRNLSPAILVEKALARGEGKLNSTGALCVNTGKYTGRSPNDKFIVDSAGVHDEIAWGKVNVPTTQEVFDALYEKMVAYLQNREIFIFDGFAGADPKYTKAFRVINELASQNLFIHQLLLRPTEEALANYKPDFTIICAPGFKCIPERDHVNSEAAIMIDYEKKMVLIAGSQYAGEIKKSVFSVMNYLMPKEGVAEDAEISWQEDVEVVKEFVDSTQILEQEDAVKVLESTTEATQSYTVQSGDAPYLIANEFKTTVEKLNQLNEGANLTGGIRVGQVINVPVQKPKISVKTVETQVLTAVEPKTYQTQYDDTKPSSYQKVIQQGKAGQKKSTIRITRINGEVTEEKEVDKEIIQEAVPEIIVKGTQ